MEFFIEMNLFKDELHEQMKLFLANGHGDVMAMDNKCTHNDTEFDHYITWRRWGTAGGVSAHRWIGASRH
jgi:hypothetical protein